MFFDCVWFPLLTLILSYSVYCLPDRWCAAVPCRRIRESPISHHFHCLDFRLHFLWLLVLGTACDKTVADICRLESSYTANCRSSAPRRIGEVYMGWDLRRSSVLGTLETFSDPSLRWKSVNNGQSFCSNGRHLLLTYTAFSTYLASRTRLDIVCLPLSAYGLVWAIPSTNNNRYQHYYYNLSHR